MPKRIINLCNVFIIFSFLSSIFAEVNFGDKGSIWSNGIFSYSFVKSEFVKTNSFSCAPAVRFFPVESVFIGPRFDWLSIIDSYEGSTNRKRRDHLFGFGIDFGGLFNGNMHVLPYFSLGCQFEINYIKDSYTIFNLHPYNGNSIFQDTTILNTIKGVAIPLSIGLIFPIKGTLALNLEIGYQQKIRKEQESAGIFTFSFGFTGIGKKCAISTLSNVGKIYL